MGKLLAFRPVAHRTRSNAPHPRAASAPRPCDFCSAPEPAWRHPCRDFAACDVCHRLVQASRPGLAEPELRAGAVPCDFCTAARPAGRYPRLDFAACDVCHRLIEAGDREGLAERTYAMAPVPRGRKARNDVIAVILELHDKFFERTGSAQRVLTLQPIPVRPPHTPSPPRGVGSTTR